MNGFLSIYYIILSERQRAFKRSDKTGDEGAMLLSPKTINILLCSMWCTP